MQVPLSVSNGQFYGTDKAPITFKGINWSGFETGTTMVGGLTYGTTALTEEFGTVLYRIQLLGFNTIRLPFSFQAWLSSTAAFTFTPDALAATENIIRKYMDICDIGRL